MQQLEDNSVRVKAAWNGSRGIPLSPSLRVQAGDSAPEPSQFLPFGAESFSPQVEAVFKNLQIVAVVVDGFARSGPTTWRTLWDLSLRYTSRIGRELFRTS